MSSLFDVSPRGAGAGAGVELDKSGKSVGTVGRFEKSSLLADGDGGIFERGWGFGVFKFYERKINKMSISAVINHRVLL